MGAFFLYKENANVCLPDVSRVFHEKGFDDAAVFQFGNYHIYLYKKQLVHVENWIQEKENFLGCIGTVVYKGNGYRESLHAILKDKLLNNLDETKLRGNFCLLFYTKNNLEILNDKLNVQHLFTDKEESFLTSSFLAAAYAIPGQITINRRVAIEKLLTGYTIGPETLFQEVYHISRTKRRKSSWHFMNGEDFTIPKDEGKNIAKNAKNRCAKISEYLKDIEKLKNEYSPEIGLSDGYDSRTLYAATMSVWKQSIAVHTHCTEGARAHEEEKAVVRVMAPEMGSELTMVPTKSMPDYKENEIEEILRDGFYFFDGRCAYNMGAFSPVYTRKYKIATAKNNKLTLNGLGGEMYRNYYLTLKPVLNVKQWMKCHVYPSTIDNVLSKSNFKTIHTGICNKIEAELGIHWKKIIRNFHMRRFYSEVVMPDCDALNCNAHNQMLFYITPFIEWDMIQDAYKSRKALGAFGELQAKMMYDFNAKVAEYPSHYGFKFSDKPPAKYKLYTLARGFAPDAVLNYHSRKVIDKSDKEKVYFEKTKEKCAYLKDASDFIETLFPEINFDQLRKDYAMMPNSVYVSVMLYEMRDKIAQ